MILAFALLLALAIGLLPGLLGSGGFMITLSALVVPQWSAIVRIAA